MQKQQKTERETRRKAEEEQKKRKADEMLKHLNAESVKARLAYKGLISSEEL